MTEKLIGWLDARPAQAFFHMPEHEDESFGRYELDGKTVVVGRMPFTVDKNEDGWFDRYFASRAWVISCDEFTKDKLWRVTGVESFAIAHIPSGWRVGLRVVPYH